MPVPAEAPDIPVADLAAALLNRQVGVLPMGEVGRNPPGVRR
ncbi:hypothetical protein ACTWPT_06820 [Nonomuraea sp. 3N208]